MLLRDAYCKENRAVTLTLAKDSKTTSIDGIYGFEEPHDLFEILIYLLPSIDVLRFNTRYPRYPVVISKAMRSSRSDLSYRSQTDIFSLILVGNKYIIRVCLLTG